MSFYKMHFSECSIPREIVHNSISFQFHNSVSRQIVKSFLVSFDFHNSALNYERIMNRIFDKIRNCRQSVSIWFFRFSQKRSTFLLIIVFVNSLIVFALRFSLFSFESIDFLKFLFVSLFLSFTFDHITIKNFFLSESRYLDIDSFFSTWLFERYLADVVDEWNRNNVDDEATKIEFYFIHKISTRFW